MSETPIPIHYRCGLCAAVCPLECIEMVKRT